MPATIALASGVVDTLAIASSAVKETAPLDGSLPSRPEPAHRLREVDAAVRIGEVEPVGPRAPRATRREHRGRRIRAAPHGHPATMTHDYKRHGTVHLQAAMNLKTEQRVQEVDWTELGDDVLQAVYELERDAHVPAVIERAIEIGEWTEQELAARAWSTGGEDVSHRAQRRKAWLELPGHERIILHFTPTSCSWLNVAERVFSDLPQKVLR